MIDIFAKAGNAVVPVVKSTVRYIRPKTPTLLLATGIACIIGGTVLVAKQSVEKVPDILEEMHENDEIINELPDYDEDDLIKKGKHRLNHANCVTELCKVYAAPVGLVASGIGLVIGAHYIQASRLLAVGAAYNTLLVGFNEYRARVIEDQGLEADQKYLFGTEEKDAIIKKTDKNGKEKERKTTVTVLGSGDSESLYHRCFDIYNSVAWRKEPGYNLAYLMAQQSVFQRQLDAVGYVFLDDVYDKLGFDLTNYSNAKLVGWVKDGDGDGFIDFGIFCPDKPENIDFYEGNEDSIWLNFNCDGIIIDKI